MIVTITANSGIDQTIFVPSFEFNRTIRATESHLGFGGKGTVVSWILAKWGVPNLAMGFAAGGIGLQMDRMLAERGVQTDFTWVRGETRWNTVLVSQDGSGQSTITTSTLLVDQHHMVSFYEKFEKVLPKTTCLVISGSTPEGVPLDFYPHVIQRAKKAGVPVLLDSSGPYLQVGVEAGPGLIKPNLPELEALVGRPARDREDVLKMASQLQQNYGVNVIATLGEQGAWALMGKTRYWIPSIAVKVVSSAGAGDAVVAGMAVACSRKESLESGLRLGFALATAMLLTAATGDFNPDDARKFLPQVELCRL
jgi:1-phosphofructokinase family hexose kinase